MTTQPLRKSFPQLAKHEGVWEGWYRYVDAEGNLIDKHKSKLVCRLPKDQPTLYHQTNYYTWEDGKTDVRDFKGYASEDKIIFDNDLIKGWAGGVSLDDSGRSIMLHWERVAEPETYLYEMIQISDCGQYRSRVWQWLKNGQITQRTLVDEQRISHDWSGL